MTNWQHTIKAILKNSGMTQRKFAADNHLAPATVCEWLSGKYEPRDMVKKIIEKKYKKHLTDIR